MATLKYIARESSDTVSANKIMNFNIAAYDSICQIFLNFTNNGAAATVANILSSIQRIRLIVNGEDIVNVSPTDLTNAIKSLGQRVYHNSASNVIPLNIVKLMYEQMGQRGIFDIGCDAWAYNGNQAIPVSNIQIQITCGGTITNITDVEVSTERVQKGTAKNITVAYGKLLTYEQNISGTGTHTVDTLPKNLSEGYLAVFATPGTSGVISKGEVKVNNAYAIQESTIDVMNSVINQRGYGEVLGIFPYIFADGTLDTALSMVGVNDFRFNTTFSTAPTDGKYNLVALTVKKANNLI